jgi:hypothetical protein
MPTESFEIASAAGYHYDVFTVAKPFQLLDQVKSSLVAAGWTAIEGLTAKWRLHMPYGLPYTSEPNPPPPPVEVTDGQQLFRVDTYDESGVRTSRKRFCAIDTYRNSIIEHPGIVWVPLGVTPADTVENLAREINDHTDFTVTARYQYGGTGYSWIIELEAATGGTAAAPYSRGGCTDLMGDTAGFWNVVTYAGGAGWHLSETYGSTTLHLRLVAGTGYPEFRFQLGTAGAEILFMVPHPTPHPAAVTYEAVASRYQFWLWNPNYYWANVMACLPYLWSGRGITSAAVVAGGYQLRDSLLWPGGMTAVAVNGAFTGLLSTSTPAHRLTGLCASWNLGPFAYASGDDLVENALIMAPRADLTDEVGSRVIGKMWNAGIMRRDATKGEIIARASQRYMCVARNGGYGKPAASLWIRIE